MLSDIHMHSHFLKKMKKITNAFNWNVLKLTRPFKRLMLIGLLVLFNASATAEQDIFPDESLLPTLNRAVMCEGVQSGLPVDQTIVFDVNKGSAYCWSNFDPVHADGIVFHEWYRNGKLMARFKLAVHPPSWANYSSLRLRQTDIGPWQLSITDEEGKTLTTLRFSITE